MAMAVVAAASRVQAMARLASRRLLSSGGKVLGEEEKAAENIYIKKMEQEKLARKGPIPGEQGSSTPAAGASTDQNKNYTVIAGAVGVVGASAIAWYLLSKPEKSEEVGACRSSSCPVSPFFYSPCAPALPFGTKLRKTM